MVLERNNILVITRTIKHEKGKLLSMNDIASVFEQIHIHIDIILYTKSES